MNLNHRLHARRHGLVHRARNPLTSVLTRVHGVIRSCLPLFLPFPPLAAFRLLWRSLSSTRDFNRRTVRANAVSFSLLLRPLPFFSFFFFYRNYANRFPIERSRERCRRIEETLEHRRIWSSHLREDCSFVSFFVSVPRRSNDTNDVIIGQHRATI